MLMLSLRAAFQAFWTGDDHPFAPHVGRAVRGRDDRETANARQGYAETCPRSA